MIRAIILFSLMALPAAAQQMTQESCRLGWEALNILIGEDADMIAAQPDVTAEGLCRIDDRNAPLQPNDFQSVEWRATGVEEAVVEQGVPLSLNAGFTGIDLIKGLKLNLGPEHMGQMGTMQINFMRDAETRDVALQDWTTDFGPLGRLRFQAKGGGIDLSSLKSMQFTSGGLRIYELDLAFVATQALSRALLSELPVEAALKLAADLPDHAIDSASRAALIAFLTAGPEAEGQLVVSARSENGVGFLQMVGGVKHMEEAGPSASAVAEGLSILLDGVTLTASWTAEE